MRLHPRPLVLTALSWGCGVPQDTDSPAACGVIPLADAGNYSFFGTLQPPVIETAQQTDLDVCWDALESDIQCHAVDPAADIDNVSMVRFPHLSEAEVSEGLSNNNLEQADLSGYVEVRNDGGTCTTLSSMSFFGTQIDVASEYSADAGTYLMLLTTGTTPGVGARMLAYLHPTATSENTVVAVPDGCGVLDFSADLSSLTPTGLCANGPWVLEFGAVTLDGHGNPFDPRSADTAMLAFYEGTDVGDLEANFLDIEGLATHEWNAALSGITAVDLSTATDGTSTFAGFDGDGLWVFALRCSTCANPAPLYLTLLEPK